MSPKLLLPHKFKRIGWIILFPALVLGLADILGFLSLDFLKLPAFAIFSTQIFEHDVLFGWINNNLTEEILGVACIIGAMMVAFSSEKEEDEFIAKTRWESLVWATYVNYAILLMCIIFFYGLAFLYVLVFNMLTILIIFIIRFQFILYKSKTMLRNEK